MKEKEKKLKWKKKTKKRIREEREQRFPTAWPVAHQLSYFTHFHASRKRSNVFATTQRADRVEEKQTHNE
jgi:hypothetical protein